MTNMTLVSRRRAIASLLAGLAAVGLAAVLPAAAGAQDLAPRGMFYPVVGARGKITFGWLARNSNFGNQMHLAVDISVPAGTAVYAVAEGTVVESKGDVGSYGGDTPSHPGGGMVVRHRTNSGATFYALYGHLSQRLPVGAGVKGGQRIGSVGNYLSNGKNIPHLHFGVCAPNLDSIPWRGYAPSVVGGWTNPIAFLENNAPSRDRFGQWDDLDFGREESCPEVYVMAGGARLWVPSMEGFSWDRVRPLQDGSLSGMTTFPRGGTMLRYVSRPEVWVILNFNGRPYRWWIRTEGRVNQFGGWGAVRVVPNGCIQHIPDSGISLW
jgi:hypothetical protein